MDKLYKRRWLKKYIKAVHKHDQYQAFADDLESIGDPRAKRVREMQRMYAFIANIANGRFDNLRYLT